jgi:hypothetical protein
MIDATTHTRKIWRSHFDGADSTANFDQIFNYFYLENEKTFIRNFFCV